MDEIRIERKSLYWFTGKHFELIIKKNKLSIYEIITKLIWTCGVELCDMPVKIHIAKL